MLYLKLAKYVPAILDIFGEVIRSLRADSDGGKRVTKEEAERIKLIAAAKLDLVIHDILDGEL